VSCRTSAARRVLLRWALLPLLGCGHAPPAPGPVAAPASPEPVATPPAPVRLRIATFNIQKLGPTKAGRADVMEMLVSIVRRYDLVAVQEIQDRHGEVPVQLLSLINRGAPGGDDYAMVLSPRTGQQPDDLRSQEQYAYYYRTDRLRPVGSHRLYDDSAHDHFQREPHVARFAVQGACTSFVLMNLHTRPRAALEEIAAVEHVFRWAREQYDDERHFVALGDFNAGCGYASEQDLDALPIHGEQYDWVVPHSADTNVADSQCPYDRIVISSSEGNLLVEDWGVDRAFSDRRVSDHWPVWADFTFAVDASCTR